jgi:hypothetical protein
MDLTPALLMRMMRETLTAPRAGAAAVLNIGFAPIVGWMALLLMAVTSTLLTHISFAMMPGEVQEFWGAAMGSPVHTAILQWVVLLISVHAIHRVGRWRGGHGDLQGAVILVAWLQFILLCVQIAQLVAQALVPPLADLLGLLGLVLFLWLLTNFVAQLHGFASLGLTFLGIFLTILAASFAMAFVFALLFGSQPPGA